MKHGHIPIQVGTRYALGSDALCVTLFRKRQVRKTGMIKYDPIGYFPNYEQAFHKLVDFDVQEGPKDIVGVIDRIVQLKKEITEAITNLAHVSSRPDWTMKADTPIGVLSIRENQGAERALIKSNNEPAVEGSA